MNRRYYRRSKHSNIFSLSRNEKQMFNVIADLIRMLIYIVTGACKGIWELSRYVRKIIINQRALQKIGYSLDEIINLVNTISPRQFEVLICELFHQHGYKAVLTAPTCDYGRDIILNDNIFVECKHYGKNNYVGREICQKLLGSMQMFNAKKGIIVTTGPFHKNAYEVATKVDNLQLMDIYDIEKMILDLQPEQISRVIMRTLNAS